MEKLYTRFITSLKCGCTTNLFLRFIVPFIFIIATTFTMLSISNLCYCCRPKCKTCNVVNHWGAQYLFDVNSHIQHFQIQPLVRTVRCPNFYPILPKYICLEFLHNTVKWTVSIVKVSSEAGSTKLCVTSTQIRLNEWFVKNNLVHHWDVN